MSENEIYQAACAHWPAICIAAAWVAYQFRALRGGFFDGIEYLQRHGGLLRWLGKTLWNEEGQ